MGMERVPETNSFGLVLPPSHDDFEYLKFFQKLRKKPAGIERHHLYWPEPLYLSSTLATRFRENHFNSVFITESDHDDIHDQFDGVPIPSDDVMCTALDELKSLDDLADAVEAVEMIDASVREGRVTRMSPKMIEERRQDRLEIVHATIDRINLVGFEVVPPQLAQLVVAQYVVYPERAQYPEAA